MCCPLVKSFINYDGQPARLIMSLLVHPDYCCSAEIGDNLCSNYEGRTTVIALGRRQINKEDKRLPHHPQ